MQRLTVHLQNVQKVTVDGKSKIFNTLSFNLKTGSEKEVADILRNITVPNLLTPVTVVAKHYVSNRKR